MEEQRAYTVVDEEDDARWFISGLVSSLEPYVSAEAIPIVSMTEEESEIHMTWRKEQNYSFHRTDFRYDFHEYDIPVEHRDSISTQNPDFCRKSPDVPGISKYYTPDDTYTSERNADPCPFIPKEMYVPYNERIHLRCRRAENGRAYDFINSASDYERKREKNWFFTCKLLSNLLGLGGLCLIGDKQYPPIDFQQDKQTVLQGLQVL